MTPAEPPSGPSRDHAPQLLAALRAVAVHFGAEGPDLTTLPGPHPDLMAMRLRFPPETDLFFIQAGPFPELPPLALCKWGTESSWLPLDWAADGPGGADRLITALEMHIAVSRAEYRVAWGPSPTRPLTEDPEVAARAGWRRVLTGAPVPPALHESAAVRVGPSLIGAFAASRVLVFGLGSVGSYVCEQLVRSGVGQLTIVDFDTIEAHNLSRTSFDMEDVGRPKAEAMIRRLLAISPSVSLEAHETRLDQVEPGRLRQLFESADLVIAATDDPAAQGVINACSFHAATPALFVGLYRGARGGEVAMTIPGITPCFDCQTGGQRALPVEARPEKDYGTGRLAGEVALGCDIQHVASAALRLAFSILASRREVEGSLRRFFLGAMRAGTPMVTLGMEPHFWFYDRVFRDVAGQYAFQSVWMSASSRAGCVVCGTQDEARDDPFDQIASPVDNAAVLRQFRALQDEAP